jgi:prepilin-type N-terminal cleavage/methylation domain-containing protein
MYSANASICPIRSQRSGFTLIELLIVVAIIAVLAAIAVPNFIEAQTRSKVARVQADLRTLALGLESYRVDQNSYPEGSDNPDNWDPQIADFLGALAPGYYTMATRHGTALVGGRDFFTLTTPIAYVSDFYTDPFAGDGNTFITYSYRPAKTLGNGYVLTSLGPDNDLMVSADGRPGVGTLSTNPLSTYSDTNSPARIGDINERAVIHCIEGTDPALVDNVRLLGGLRTLLDDLSYDPTNGTLSDGDVYRLGP